MRRSNVSMRRSMYPAFFLGAAVGVASIPAFAVTCYEVIDRSDAVIYRDSRTPVDLSEAGARARDAMRDRGELLLIYDAPSCSVIRRSGKAGGGSLTVDEIVAEWRNNWGMDSYGMWSPIQGRTSAPSATSRPSPRSAGY